MPPPQVNMAWPYFSSTKGYSPKPSAKIPIIGAVSAKLACTAEYWLAKT